MTRAALKAQLAQLGLQPKHSWGQNFLVDDAIVARIVAATHLVPGEVAVELGAGLGQLTLGLAARGARVVAVERDRDLARALRTLALPGVEIVEADAAHADYCAIGKSPEVVVVGNLPYHLTSSIVFGIVAQVHGVPRAVFTVQKEVAARLAATPGTRDWGILGVLVGHRYRVDVRFTIPPEAFYPAPKVTSAVVAFTRLAQPAADIVDEELFRRVVKAAFGQRRKTLANALRAALPLGVDAATLLTALGIEPRRRAETLSISEFAALARAVGEASAANQRE